MKDTALLSANSDWALMGKRTDKKAFLTLKHPEKGSVRISEKDLKPIVTLLETMETIMKDEGEAKR
jgi:hypothetical protein